MAKRWLLDVELGGTNHAEKLLPDVHLATNAMMRALRNYGESIDDWSMKSAIVASGYRPDNAGQGRNYLRIIKLTISQKPSTFGSLEFPANLEEEAQSVLGRPGDPRRRAFVAHVAAAPGWSAQLASTLLKEVDNAYAPRGSNPHATGMAFDLDFSIIHQGTVMKLGANKALNGSALRSAAGVWLNTYAPRFGFDSYDTDAEIWHQEFRRSQLGAGSPGAITLLDCCQPALEIVDDLLRYGEQKLLPALKRMIP